uniref:Uncharacterized protein n=1 Tax=Amphimedon queenslandica TaxID=400682 RepID=A0A1X7U5M6_AMPQE
ITVKLQRRAIDIVDAYNNIDEILSLYRQLRSNIDSTFHTIYIIMLKEWLHQLK